MIQSLYAIGSVADSEVLNINEPHIRTKVFIVVVSDNCSPGRMAQSVERLTQEPEVPGLV